MNFGLPPGDWRYDPAKHIQVWVPLDPDDMRDDDEDQPVPTFLHGTENGYKSHRKYGTEVCASCREALNSAARRRRANRRLNQTKDAA